MKGLKKLLSGILTVCLILSMVYVPSFATDTVSTLNVVIERPQIGGVPATTASVQGTANAEVVNIKWSPADSVFKADTTYTATITLSIKSGVDAVFAAAESTSITVNGGGVYSRVQTSGQTAVIKFGWKLRTSETNQSVAQNTVNTTTTKSKSGFVDVNDSEYYADAVCWAVDKKITTGTTTTTFSPDDTCTRAQILTFLWRAVDSPKTTSYLGFNDVQSTDYFAGAADWARGKSMVSGTVFEPDTPCTRAYTVMYLWKNAGSPQTEVSNVFTDVASNADYAQAVAWAIKNGVTKGTTTTTFSPNETCTRGQIVTFLNRALASSSQEDTNQNVQTDQTQTTIPTDVNNPTDTTISWDTPVIGKTEETETTDTTAGGQDVVTNQESATLPVSNMSKEELEETVTATTKNYDTAVYEAAVQKALREALGDGLGKNMTQLQKALQLHDWLVLNCRYDEAGTAKYSRSEYGAIVEGMAVCSGYTKAYNDLLSRVGIEAESVDGFLGKISMNTAHVWSRITIDGKKYHVDVTADDPIPDRPGRVNYTYFLKSDAGLKDHLSYKLHCTDTEYDNNALFKGYAADFMWDSRINKHYYVDMTEVKTTSDFSETLQSATSSTGAKPTSSLLTKDGKYVCFFKPSYYTSEYPMYLYSIDTGKYYTYTVKGVKNIIFDRLVQKGNYIQPTKDYRLNGVPKTVADASIPLPSTSVERTVTFNENYNGGKSTSCQYLNNYWTSGTGSFAEPKRTGYTFAGWYTTKDGGTKVENFDDISGDDVTLYAHWWGSWSISEKPTMTESGKAVRSLDGNASIKDEITIPNLSDTSVWTKKFTIDATPEKEGLSRYVSEYGTVDITIPNEELK